MPNPAAPFPRRTEDRTRLGTGHRVTPKQQEQHSLAQIPHSQSHARPASPVLPVPALQRVGTTRATPFLPPSPSRDHHLLPVPPASPGQHPQGRGSPKYLLPADVALPQPGQVSAGLGSPGPMRASTRLPLLRSHPAGCARARQVRTGRQRRADCERSRAERGAGLGSGRAPSRGGRGPGAVTRRSAEEFAGRPRPGRAGLRGELPGDGGRASCIAAPLREGLREPLGQKGTFLFPAEEA